MRPGDAEDFADGLVAAAKARLRTPVGASFVIWWIVGVYLVLYAAAPIGVTPEMRDRFE